MQYISGTDLLIQLCVLPTEIEVADSYLTLPQFTESGPAGPRADPVMPGTWQGML